MAPEDRFVMASAVEKRVLALEQYVGTRRARTDVIKVPTQIVPVEGSVESDTIVPPEIHKMLAAIGVTGEDTVRSLTSTKHLTSIANLHQHHHWN